MAAEPQPQYQHLEARPGSNYRQLFLKGRRIRAAVVDEEIHGPDPRTPEEFARDFQVPLEAVHWLCRQEEIHAERKPDHRLAADHCRCIGCYCCATDSFASHRGGAIECLPVLHRAWIGIAASA